MCVPSFSSYKYDKVAVYLPPRKVELPVEDKPVSLFAAKAAKPNVLQVASTSSLSTSRPAADDGDDIYKTNPVFVSIVEPIANKFMPLKELIGKLRLLGLNVFPEPDADSYVSVINKNHKLEWWVYNQMAMVSTCTAFSYSHWNAFVNDEMKIVIGCKEQLIDQSTHDDDLRCIIFTSELVGFTDVCESSQEFTEASTFTDYHSEFFHLAREKFSPEAVARIMDASPLFIETVNQLLSSIKPLTYA
ncbi:unnamed protein product [Rotaria magnacalcarata]|uniref:Uncharacterized protein n=3 Tax=Rotaria magnacalcarata TaxID=392030 RepID=A0A816V2K8_9BILA|nr:unnamed protein product [Rotaria magnacalcarata]CAF2070720.1 unnamed protein product [Rotaria magnacalcarata]CAF2118537.1 unnamed protein product [Rotaria magnacalcarata]CAF3741246.1 unnamed protein product [Rotaria magnacalcarata]CAF3810643.1 unnamed protein product [Rotaria magnacalcarata]